MMVIDSSAWIEYLLDRPLASAFAPYLGRPGVMVPALVVYEVYKVMRRARTEEEAEKAAIWMMENYSVIPLDGNLALEAADYSLRHGLSLADAVVYATARATGAPLLTSASHFAELPGIELISADST